jgi:ribonuclease VapC
MIVADSSVIVAIMRHEDDADLWTDVLDRTARTFMSVVAYVETGMVMTGRRLDVDPLTAFIRFGKGRHRAALNLADCFTYALAKSRDLPLLFKGDDFSQTDIVPAWRP